MTKIDEHASYAETIKQYENWELDDILHHVDRTKFPERYQVLVNEISRRVEEQKTVSSGQENVPTGITVAKHPNTIREHVWDLLQPVKGKRAVAVRYTNNPFLWTLTGVLVILALCEVLIILAADSGNIRVGASFILALQVLIIFTACLKRPSVVFFMKFWSGILVLYSFVNIRGLTSSFSETVLQNAPNGDLALLDLSVVITMSTILGIGIVSYAFAEKCIIPLFNDAEETPQENAGAIDEHILD